jgi:hypothetical protein
MKHEAVGMGMGMRHEAVGRVGSPWSVGSQAQAQERIRIAHSQVRSRAALIKNRNNAHMYTQTGVRTHS